MWKFFVMKKFQYYTVKGKLTVSTSFQNVTIGFNSLEESSIVFRLNGKIVPEKYAALHPLKKSFSEPFSQMVPSSQLVTV